MVVPHDSNRSTLSESSILYQWSRGTNVLATELQIWQDAAIYGKSVLIIDSLWFFFVSEKK